MLSFAQFQRKLLYDDLPIDWASELAVFLKDYFSFYRIGLPDSAYFWIINTPEYIE